jgi:dihydroorotate dehydrogenase (fumarate)
MADTSTTWLGLNLRTPVIAGSCGLTGSVDALAEMEAAGAGAVVLKSIFEEALTREDAAASAALEGEYGWFHKRMTVLDHAADHLELIREAKYRLSIPVIASINCVTPDWWPDYAAKMEQAGADALELNVFTTATDLMTDGRRVEELHYRITAAVRARVSIPFALKIGPYFTSLPNVAHKLGLRGARGLVLFNRFTQPDIDPSTLELRTVFSFSTHSELSLPLRAVALLSGDADVELCASTGVKSGDDVARLVLAGARAVQVASAMYTDGVGVLRTITDDFRAWMDAHGFERIDDIRGIRNLRTEGAPQHWLRSQFVDKISGVTA